MPWWLWILFGLALAVLELQVPANFYLLAFGIGAILVGILAGVGGGPAWMQWLLFTGFSLAAAITLQRTLSRAPSARSDIDTLIGELAIPAGEILPGAIGRAELRGTTWSAGNAGETPLAKGQRCRVERVEGLTLWIRPE